MTKSADLNHLESTILSIRLCADGFSFSISNPAKKEAGTSLYWEAEIDTNLPAAANLKQVFQTDKRLKGPFHKVNVLVSGKRFTTVPTEWFNPGDLQNIFYYNHPKQDNETVLFDAHPGLGLVLLFGMDVSAYHCIIEHYPQARFYPQAGPLLEYFSRQGQADSKQKLYVHLREKGTDVFAFNTANRLLLANSYPCESMADRLYYVLYLWKTLDFDQENDNLYISGKTLGELEHGLRKFIRNVFPMNPSINIDLQALNHTCE